MSPVLFNLFSCAVLERWKQKLDGVGVQLYYKFDQKLYRRYTKNASTFLLRNCLFADDGVIKIRNGAVSRVPAVILG